MKATMKLSFSLVMLAVMATVLTAPVSATKGNNGTLKVHEQNTPSGTESNDPKVCTFNFEGYGFDEGQSGMIVITTQGGGNNKDEVKSLAMPAATAADEHGTYTETEYITLPDGHYKSTVYGKDNHGEYKVDLKAKSKVFKVDCDTTSETPNEVDTPETPNEGGVGGDNTNTPDEDGKVLAESASTTKGAGEAAPLPSEVPATGGNLLQTLVNTLLAGAGVYSATAYLRRK